jgi:hypothetical protein
MTSEKKTLENQLFFSFFKKKGAVRLCVHPRQITDTKASVKRQDHLLRNIGRPLRALNDAHIPLRMAHYQSSTSVKLVSFFEKKD